MTVTSSIPVPSVALVDATRGAPGARLFARLASLFACWEPEPEIESHHKKLVTRFVLPIMAGVTFLFYVGHWSNEPIKVATALVCIAGAGANVFLTTRDRQLRLGRFTFHSRSDAVDALRWTLNLAVFDAALALVFRPGPGVFVGTWLVLLASAQADTFRHKHRAFVVGFGLVVGGLLFVHLYPFVPTFHTALIVFCMASLLVILALTEAHWRAASWSAAKAHATSAAMAEEAARVGREASLGGHIRTFSQGMGNVAAVLEHVASVPPGEITARHLELVRSASAYANRLSSVALGDEASFFGQRRTHSADALLRDLEVLGVKEVRARGFAWELKVKAPAGMLSFEEWSGSALAILHALLRCACESHGNGANGNGTHASGTNGHGMHANETHANGTNGGGVDGRSRCLRLVVETQEGDLVFRVEGEPRSAEPESQRAPPRGDGPPAAHAPRLESSGVSSGLGLLLVRAECDRNGFGLEIASRGAYGPAFSLVIPSTALRS